VQRPGIGEKRLASCCVDLLADQTEDGVIESRNGQTKVMGKILLPYQFHGLHGFRPESWVGFISRRIVVKLKQVGGDVPSIISTS
jgi:hypothetical protein